MCSIKSQPSDVVKGISFGFYTKENIIKSSVLEVINPQSFDSLEHPCREGLYDPRLGPNRRNELCPTCGENYFQCPGHLGHITIPVPVFNPFFFKTLYKLLRSSCLSCNKLMATTPHSLLLHHQMLAVDHGRVELVEEMEIVVNNMVKKSEPAANEIYGELKKMTQDLKSDLDDTPNSLSVKNMLEFRQRLVKNFFMNSLLAKVAYCFHCSAPKRSVAQVNNAQFILAKVGARRSRVAKPKPSANKRKEADQVFPEDGELIMDEEEEEKATTNVCETNQTILTPLAVRDHLIKLWENDKIVLQHLYPMLDDPLYESPTDVFFVDTIPVPPCKFRPLNRMGDKTFENPQTILLTKIMQMSKVVRVILRSIKESTEIEPEMKFVVDRIVGASMAEKLQNSWIKLQLLVNSVVDNDPGQPSGDSSSCVGVKQVIEKKEGLFRMNMMGKRVNYAARSVISPDPFINIDEIGIPDTFAKKLTFPQQVTPWNVTELRELVMNGPDVYPGANSVHNSDDHITLLTKDPLQREAVAKQLLAPTLGKGIKPPKMVYRHLRNGDMLLVNRQPTLHKPSIMAHKARILKGERTLRLHYSNCKTYNADFDGDEMNVHFPQSQLARSEAKYIANVTNQFLVPKDGTPLGGLIQDHMIASVHMTIRGQFFNQKSYQNLVFGALPVNFVKRIKLLPPTIRKVTENGPRVYLWSGKQIISTILINLIPENKQRITLEGVAKVAPKSWQKQPPRKWLAGGTPLKDPQMTESEIVIRQGEWLVGVLDKAHCGPTSYGLIHACYELYGGDVSSNVLSAFGRLFAHYLKGVAFSFGSKDILTLKMADKMRKKATKTAESVGFKAAAEAFGVKDVNDHAKILEKFEFAHRDPEELGLKVLDSCMKSKTDEISNRVNKVIMPSGLLKQFPENNLQLMVLSGAKGATVNSMQISCMLGQIELEGRRPPLSVSGTPLPVFLKYDCSPRAGGFVSGRFETGIRHPEFFYHCMAGREGLTDTAVKTSRSGYLQRCLIKHLEGLTVHYDMTVRDSDGSVIQFMYGEDGLDVQKATFLNPDQMTFWASNYSTVHNPQEVAILAKDDSRAKIEKQKHAIRKWNDKNSDTTERTSPFLKFCSKNSSSSRNQLISKWGKLSEEEYEKYVKKVKNCPEPVVSKFNCSRHWGSIAEKVDSLIDDYVNKNPDNLLTYEEEKVTKKKKSKKTKSRKVDAETFRETMHLKAIHSVCESGEAVGLLAAQSVGEPSTQMTLNTFHFAGRGEMNVTLGIPRMREILMTAGSNMKTPSMDVPFLPEAVSQAEEMKLRMTKVHLNKVLKHVEVTDLLVVTNERRERIYKVHMKFLPPRSYRSMYYVTPAKILKHVEHEFIKKLTGLLQAMSSIAKEKMMHSGKTRSSDKDLDEINEEPSGGNGGDMSDDEAEHIDDDAAQARRKARHNHDGEYDEPENEEIIEEKEQLEDEQYEEHDEGYETVKVGEDDSSMDAKDAAEAMASNEKLKKKQCRDSETNMERTRVKRINQVLNLHGCISSYDFDTEGEEWCTIEIKLPLEKNRVDFSSIIMELSAKSVIHQVPDIERAFLSDSGDKTIMKTEGVNMLYMFQFKEIFDLNRLYCNNIQRVAETYGIEAARNTIVKEIQNVFKVYGILVDPRHLLLIADYMTFDGVYRALNRFGMELNTSPLQQMSFETTMHFLTSATLAGSKDSLQSPSAQIVMGNAINVGTGSFNVLYRL